MTIHLEWEGGIHPIYIFVSSSKLVVSENILIDDLDNFFVDICPLVDKYKKDYYKKYRDE